MRDADLAYMRLALRLARRGYGSTAPNPMVGAVLVKGNRIIGRGWHRRAGQPHAEVEALRDAQRHGQPTQGASLYVTLEPCCTHGRTPPCTEAIIAAGIRTVFVGAIDPNPRHAGGGLVALRQAGLHVTQALLGDQCERLNEAFNFWITRGRPFVTVKAAMTLDGKIASPTGESKWITGKIARRYAMRLRQGADAILVGINTILSDDPALTVRLQRGSTQNEELGRRRFVLDALARTPRQAKVVTDEFARLTSIVVSKHAPSNRVRALEHTARVIVAPAHAGQINLPWLLKQIGAEQVTSLLVEGGGEVNASFLLKGLAQRVAFFYAPKVLGGAQARKAVAGEGAKGLDDSLVLKDIEWRRVGADWLLLGNIRTNP